MEITTIYLLPVVNGLMWSNTMDEKTKRIRELNDILRTSFTGGRILTTIGIRRKPVEDVARILSMVRSFNKFNKNNNIYGENDYGKFAFKDDVIIWKIDYYDKNYRYHSEDPSNPDITNRVMTIMTSEEY